jgi:hypothetical protein
MPRYSKWSLSIRSPNQTLHAPLLCPTHNTYTAHLILLHQVRGLIKYFARSQVVTGRSCYHFTQNPIWRITHCWPSSTAFKYIRSYPPHLEAVLPSATRRRFMLWLDGPRDHSLFFYFPSINCLRLSPTSHLFIATVTAIDHKWELSNELKYHILFQ